MSNLFSWILDDKNFSYVDKPTNNAVFEVIQSGITINSINIELDHDTVSCVNVTKSQSMGISYKDFMLNVDGEYTYNFIATYNIKCKITMWTPMLMLFALTRIEDTKLTDDIITKMTNDTKILTVKKFNEGCNTITKDNKQTCHGYITTYCKTFTNTTKFPPELIGKYLFDGNIGGGGNACNCYNSVLQPPVTAKPGNLTAMCFDSNCNNNNLEILFDLNQGSCKTKCSEMWDWMFNSNPATGKPVPQFFDSARFSDICGKNYVPLESKINITFVAYLSVTMIIVMVCLYLFLLYFKVTNKKKYTILAITGAILLGITIFLPIDMKGTPNCIGDDPSSQKSVCKSSITGIPIPDDFCGFMSACECQTDTDCSKGCECISQVCIPNSSDKRTAILTKKPKVKYWQFIFSIILTILVVIIFSILLLYQDIYVAMFVLFLGLTIIIFTSITQFTTYIDTQYSVPCTKKSPSEGETLSDNVSSSGCG